jgi:NAD(P)-dependent dehydrogenase (short-subunit alcohol dehydrogenase family)
VSLLGAALAKSAVRRRRAIDPRGLVALITGGSRGLGLLLARELGCLGARVALVARDDAELKRAKEDLQAHGVDVAVIVADVADEDAAERIVREVLARHGRLDILRRSRTCGGTGAGASSTSRPSEASSAFRIWCRTAPASSR